MYLTIESSSPTVRVTDVDDLGRFHVIAPAWSADDIERVLTRSGAGHFSADVADHCWIRVSFLREHADRAADEMWNCGFDNLLAYARSREWMDDARPPLLDF